MLGKLFKYDFSMLSRSIIPLYWVLGILTLITKALSLAVKAFESTDSDILVWIQLFSNVFYAIYSIFLYVSAIFIILSMVYRFYRNFFTTQSYLMFTLPIKNIFLIISKILSTICYFLLSLLTFGASLLLVYFDTNLINRINTEVKNLDADKIKQFAIISLFVFSLFVLFILTTYLSIALGHLLKKLKILGSFLWFIGINFIVQILILSSSLIISYMSGSNLLESFNFNPIIFTIVVNLIVSILFVFITNHIISKKLSF